MYTGVGTEEFISVRDFFGKRTLLPKRPLKVCQKQYLAKVGKRASRIATDVLWQFLMKTFSAQDLGLSS